eukprot:g16848.t1
MSQYAGDYQKYMSAGGGDYSKYYQKYMDSYGSGGSGGYQQYMSDGWGGIQWFGGSEYADKYAAQYMPGSKSKSKEDSAAPVVVLAAEAKKDDKHEKSSHEEKASHESSEKSESPSESGGYQKFMDKYSKDYKQYMQSQGSQGKGPGDYQKTRRQDYEHYMQERGQNVSKGFEKYMADHASKYKHYLQARGSEAAGDFQKYFADYQKYMKDQEFKSFVEKYASDYAKYLKDDGLGSERGSKYMDWEKKTPSEAPEVLAATQPEDEQTKEKDALAADILSNPGSFQERLQEEMKYEKELREKEKEHLREELKQEDRADSQVDWEAKEAVEEKKGGATEVAEPIELAESKSSWPLGVLSLAAFAAVIGSAVLLRRRRQIREHEDYVMHLDAPLSTVPFGCASEVDWGAQVVRARQVVAERAPLIQQQLSQATSAMAEARTDEARHQAAPRWSRLTDDSQLKSYKSFEWPDEDKTPLQALPPGREEHERNLRRALPTDTAPTATAATATAATVMPPVQADDDVQVHFEAGPSEASEAPQLVLAPEGGLEGRWEV